ncbi:FkbM family methyltransferase [Beggiatoa alba]|nr:FkbM family methyltransferase [Beggiatoa alba]
MIGSVIYINFVRCHLNFRNKKKIFRVIKNKEFTPIHVAEVGVYKPETSNIYDFILNKIKATLVEPDKLSIKLIEECFKGYDNVTLHPYAIYEKSGEIELVQRNASTFISELDTSPAIINDEYTLDKADTFVVEAKTFDEIDDGSIDLLSIDIEGGEWYVIKNLVSRPAVISVETHGAIYINPFITEIKAWMENNNYKVLYKDRSDTVFVDPKQISLSITDKIKLYIYEVYLALRRYRKIVKKRLRK